MALPESWRGSQASDPRKPQSKLAWMLVSSERQIHDTLYLDEASRIPFTPPKVESATATGIRNAKGPYKRPANV